MKKKKYNNKSTKFADWTTQKLKQEAIGYQQQIEIIGCFGTKDVMNYYAILDELESRGITHVKHIQFLGG